MDQSGNGVERRIETAGAPSALGSYAQGRRSSRVLYTSGQIGLLVNDDRVTVTGFASRIGEHDR